MAITAADLRVIISADDQASAKLRAVGDETERTSSRMARFGPIASAGMLAGGAAVTAFAMESVASFSSFQKQMNEVFTLMPGISGPAMAEMTGQVKDFAQEFGVLPEKVVPALYESLSSGVPPGNVFDFLTVAQKAASGGVSDLTTVVDGLTSVVNTYGANVITAGQASDIMFTAVKLGKTTFDELSKSLYEVNPTASSLGVSFDQVAAALAAMTAQGVPTTVATDQLKTMLAELGKEGGEADKLFRQIAGQSFPAFVAGGGTVQQALQLMEQHAKTNNLSMLDLFGALEAGLAALTLTGKGTEAFSLSLAEMATSAGATEAAYAQMQSGMADDTDRLMAKIAVFKLDFGEKLVGISLAIIDANLGRRLIETIQPGIDFWYETIPATLGAGWARVVAIFESGISTIGSAWSAGWDAIKLAVNTGMAGVVGYFQELPGRITAALGNLASLLVDAGTDLIRGMIGGIRSMAGQLASAAAEVVSSAVGAAKGALGIRSPSTVMAEEVGIPMAEGVAAGYIEGLQAAMPAMMAATAKQAASLHALATTPAGKWPGEKGAGGGGGAGGDMWARAAYENAVMAASLGFAGAFGTASAYGPVSTVGAAGMFMDPRNEVVGGTGIDRAMAPVAAKQDETNRLLALIAELLGISVEEARRRSSVIGGSLGTVY